MKTTSMKLGNLLRSNLLTILTIFGVICGIILGIILREVRPNGYTHREVIYVNFIGDLFLRLLKSLILPLIITSLISAIGSLNLRLSGKIGGRAVAYYLLTTILAVILGIILVVIIQPGVNRSDTMTDTIDEDTIGNNSNRNLTKFNNTTMTTNSGRNVTTVDTLLDLVRNMFPPNLIQACIEQYQTVLKSPSPSPMIDNRNNISDLNQWLVSGEYVSGMNILGLVVASTIFGIALSSSSSKNECKLIITFFNELNSIIMKITSWIIWLSPIGILFLISSKLIEMDDLSDVIGKLGLYFLTVTCGILAHGLIVLPLIYFMLVRKNPYSFIANMGQAMATAFGTSSSSATLPVTIQCLEQKNGIDSRVSRFVLPIGATINMDGTALYEAVAAIFIAQLHGMELTFGNIVAISITATAASIGAAGIPQAGLVTMVMVLDTIGLPAEDVSLIIAVDWLLDRVRTVINVLGDSFGAGIVAHYSRKELQPKEKNIAFEMEDEKPKSPTIIENGSIDECQRL